MGDIAKVFWSGRSQAVRLPKEFRFDGKEVRIRKEGDAVILEPIEEDEWSDLPRLSDEDADAILAFVEEEVPQQERPELDGLFDSL
ncbi:MAG: type II toxin-antitoxin system VapB family antitoxin [Methylobacterium sp.]|uniref:antitoxin n=1 Tax=Methylobacterium sp. TaxID=409 RepID=UPI0025FF9189|nr:type II toxin-antitoxin system VapB family antitoxin [Methylobacterium sp.]MBX9931961.1 type II toxin-antitoxin system VapB family antitoxin [Methylobacterium sp.]